MKDGICSLGNQHASPKPLDDAHYWATHSRLWPMIQAAKSFKAYLKLILNYFAYRVTNAVAEGLNSKIESILKSAYGYRNRENFKTAVYLHCGGLSLYPATHTKVG